MYLDTLLPIDAVVTTDIDASGLPEGSEACLVSQETGEEICEPIPPAGQSAHPAGVLAFRQASSTVTITFNNVPPGTWRLVIRAPGFHDLVIGEIVLGAFDTTVSVPPVTAAELANLEPVEMGQITVVSEFCKNGKKDCSGRVKDAEGLTVTYVVARDGQEVQRITVPIGRSGGWTHGQATGEPLEAGVAYTVCQLPIAGYGPANGDSGCITVTLEQDGTTITFTNRAVRGSANSGNVPVAEIGSGAISIMLARTGR